MANFEGGPYMAVDEKNGRVYTTNFGDIVAYDLEGKFLQRFPFNKEVIIQLCCTSDGQLIGNAVESNKLISIDFETKKYTDFYHHEGAKLLHAGEGQLYLREGAQISVISNQGKLLQTIEVRGEIVDEANQEIYGIRFDETNQTFTVFATDFKGKELRTYQMDNLLDSSMSFYAKENKLVIFHNGGIRMWGRDGSITDIEDPHCARQEAVSSYVSKDGHAFVARAVSPAYLIKL